MADTFFQWKAEVLEQDVGRKESLFVEKSEHFDRRVKCHFQGHTEYYAVTERNAVSRIQSPHPTIGCREIQLRLIKLSSDEALIKSE